MDPKKLLDKTYDWESLYDLQRDVHEAIEDNVSGEFKGTVKVTIEYTQEEQS